MRVDFKQFVKTNKCEIRCASLDELLQVNMREKNMLRIAIIECNKLSIKERGLWWKALANNVDEINEKRCNINMKMLEFNMNMNGRGIAELH